MANGKRTYVPETSSFCLFLTLVVHIHNSMTSSSAIVFGNVTDLRALLDIKAGIQDDPFQALSSWNDSASCCEWSGVSCGHLHDQRVTSLNFSSFGLVGSLSPSIGNLTFLREIYFQGNHFQGGIPGEIGKLFRLEDLVLANNSFRGEIPGNLTHCSALRVLDLSGNSLQGNIPIGFGLFSKLLDLRLSRNQLSGRIPPSLGNISSLQNLALMKNNLSGNIPAEIAHLSSLQALLISSNLLSGDVPSQIFNISTLEILSITNNFLTGEFPGTLGLTLPNLVLFRADLNQFHGSIPATLTNATGLNVISLGDNALSGPIPLNLGSLKQLQVLHLGHNPLGTHKANDIIFISSLTNCTNLEILSLSRIQIGGVLPNTIANLSTKLTSLWLNDNIISGILPPGIGNLVSLSYLDVRNNSLGGIIPDSLGQLTNMQRLHLSENRFSGEIPFSLGRISGLQLLTLDQNALTGSIPVSLSNCTDLEGLVLSDNRLSGNLPEKVLGLSSLSRYLILGQNQFDGAIPDSVGNLVHLVELDISENKLSGEIPGSLGGCEMLEALFLEGNFLEGPIPPSLGQLKSIEVMDLSRNNLSGQIPDSLAKLNFISNLNLSYNMLEGQVPKDGIFTNSSLFSVIGNKNLCGGAKSLNLTSCPDPKPSKHKPKLSTFKIVAIAICILIGALTSLASAYAICKKRGLKKKKPSTTYEDAEQMLRVSYRELYDCSNGFSPQNLIGEGRYGAVYKAILEREDLEEKMVAVKVLKLHQHGASKSFLAECKILRNIRHRNLVKIITACSSLDLKGNDFKALVFEYASNGSLDKWLHPHLSSSSDEEERKCGLKKLKLMERLDIVIDIASALDYLHYHHSGNSIVHCDLKPGNILLHDNLRALVTDFGLARFVHGDIDYKSHGSSTAVRGTVGYVAPEYGMGGEISAQGDVYSYGIMLLEMFTGKRPTDEMFSEGLSIRSYVEMALPDRVEQIVDPRMLSKEEGEADMSSQKLCLLLSIFQIGVSCSAEMKRERMDIKDALGRLRSIRNDLALIINDD